MKRIISLVLIFCLALLPAAASCDDLTELLNILQRQKRITVTGSAMIMVLPDSADLQMGVMTYDPQFSEALKSNQEIIQAVIDGMAALGLGQECVITMAREVETVYSSVETSTTTPRMRGFRVIQSFVIHTEDISKIDTIISKAIDAGATSLDGVKYGYTDANGVYDEALSQAIQEARRKAELMASVSNATVGEVISMQEKNASYPGVRQLKLDLTQTSAEEASQWVRLLYEGLEFSASVSVEYRLE